MAIPAAQMMRPTPYHIPPRFHHAINRPPYGYNHHFTPTTHPAHPTASAFLSAATTQMLTPNVTLGTCALPITTSNCHVPSHNNPVLSHPHVANGLHTHLGVMPQGITEPQRRPSSSCSSTTSPISSSPGPLGCPPENSLSETTPTQPLKQCSYTLMNGTFGGGAGGMMGPPLASCAHGAPLLPTHPHPGATAMVSTPGGAVYAAAAASAIPSQEYGPNGINVNLPTMAGTACLPTTVPLWNPYPPLSVPNGVMNSLPPSIPKLSYDTPRYKLTPERAIPLIKWFEEHKDHPYPSRHEKMLLCQSTQLTFTQVSTWFANARRRMKKANCENADDDKAMSSDEGSQKDANSPAPLRDGNDD